SLEAGATLQRGSVYLVPLLESLDLPPHLRGRSNPKSTTGRLDIFTRVITDRTPRFDEIRAGYAGPLYLEVSPQSFPVRVQAGLSLNQLRLLTGPTSLSDLELARVYGDAALLHDDEGRPIPVERAVFNDGLCMGIALSGASTDGLIGYRAHPNPPAVDLARVGHYDPEEFWEPIKRPATATSWRPTGSTSSSPRSGSACRPGSRPRWSSMTRGRGRSGPITPGFSIRGSGTATEAFPEPRW